MNEKYHHERDFIQNAEFPLVAEYLYDYRLQQENEVPFLLRVLCKLSCYPDGQAHGILEYRTLLFYISKYGFYPETEKLVLQSAISAAASDNETVNLGLFQKLLCGLMPEYVCRRDVCRQNSALLAELQRSPDLKSPLPEYSAGDKAVFNRKYIYEYTGFLRFMGIYMID